MDHFSDEELGQVKEWIELANEGDKPPRLCIAHLATGLKPEVTRKRHIEAGEFFLGSKISPKLNILLNILIISSLLLS
jgi:hypothetical protein